MNKSNWFLWLTWLGAVGSVMGATLKTENVVLVTLDGVRWQEIFRGADAAYINKEEGGVSEKEQPLTRQTFLADTPQARRKILLPFFWSELAARGQLYGNRDMGSPAEVTNGAWVSYPGYNELLTGCVDPAITSNFPRPNPNISVLEWLDGRPALAGRVVACVTWQVFPAILNISRSKFPLWVSGGHSRVGELTPRLREIERWEQDIPTKSRDEHYDAFAFHAALEFIAMQHPRLLYVALGEGDTNGHRRVYDKYLDSIQRSDRFIGELWAKLQSLPQYRDKTTLIVTTDHGRGATPADWQNHGNKVPRSNETWLAVIGPDTLPLGERHDSALLRQTQVAATLARLLGEDYRAVVPLAGEAVTGILPAANAPAGDAH